MTDFKPIESEVTLKLTNEENEELSPKEKENVCAQDSKVEEEVGEGGPIVRQESIELPQSEESTPRWSTESTRLTRSHSNGGTSSNLGSPSLSEGVGTKGSFDGSEGEGGLRVTRSRVSGSRRLQEQSLKVQPPLPKRSRKRVNVDSKAEQCYNDNLQLIYEDIEDQEARTFGFIGIQTTFIPPVVTPALLHGFSCGESSTRESTGSHRASEIGLVGLVAIAASRDRGLCSWGRARKVASDTASPFDSVPETAHNDECGACGQGGQMIMCDQCVNSFHCGCAEPPVDADAIPDGDWLCRACLAREKSESTAQVSGANQTSSSEETEFSGPARFCAALVAKMAEKNALDFTHPPSFKTSLLKESRKRMRLDMDDDTSDSSNPRRKKPGACFYCNKGSYSGTMIMCKYCPLSYHLDCLNPPISSESHVAWMCPAHWEHFVKYPPLWSNQLRFGNIIETGGDAQGAFLRAVSRVRSLITQLQNKPSGQDLLSGKSPITRVLLEAEKECLEGLRLLISQVAPVPPPTVDQKSSLSLKDIELDFMSYVK
eukprot:Ihof_evm10s49 gene=Ihof_evmTU10s49